VGGEPGGGELAVLPRKVDGDAAAGAQAGDRAVAPGGRQRGQKLEFAALRLEQHFGNAGGAAEVAVDLKRRMGVKEIWIRALGAKQQLENRVGVFGVVEPRPEVQAPADCPAGGVVAAQLERAAGGGGEFR